LYAVLSLTVVRMIPVAIASFGLRERPPAVVLVGWLGPRGLASIVFAMLALEDLPAASSHPVGRAIALTVALSVVVHGLSARSAAALYVHRTRRRAPPGRPLRTTFIRPGG
jgi:NhaP-type Na+/H+ or K+/H+ antiporter